MVSIVRLTSVYHLPAYTGRLPPDNSTARVTHMLGGDFPVTSPLLPRSGYGTAIEASPRASWREVAFDL